MTNHGEIMQGYRAVGLKHFSFNRPPPSRLISFLRLRVANRDYLNNNTTIVVDSLIAMTF